MKLLVILLNTWVFTSMGSEVDKYLGEILPIAMFPQLKTIPSSCQWYTLDKINDNLKCTCGDKTDLPRYVFKQAATKLTQEFVPIVVNNYLEVAAAVEMQGCVCGDKNPPRLVFQPINENYFVQYQNAFIPSEDNAPNMAILFLRYTPKKSELEKFIKTIGDLGTRNYSLMCDSTFFAKEN